MIPYSSLGPSPATANGDGKAESATLPSPTAPCPPPIPKGLRERLMELMQTRLQQRRRKQVAVTMTGRRITAGAQAATGASAVPGRLRGEVTRRGHRDGVVLGSTWGSPSPSQSCPITCGVLSGCPQSGWTLPAGDVTKGTPVQGLGH